MSDEGGAGNTEPTHCPMTHEGMKEMLSVIVPTGVDDLFTLLFTNSSFLLDFLQNTRKSTGNLKKKVNVFTDEGEKIHRDSTVSPAVRCRVDRTLNICKLNFRPICVYMG